MTVKELQKQVHETARCAGWYDGELGNKTELRLISMLCLIHSEISEALEAIRYDRMITNKDDKGKPQGLPSELADATIRILDTCEWLGIDLETEIRLKDAYNRTRSYRHGGKKI